jgi:hypothetical protein
VEIRKSVSSVGNEQVKKKSKSGKVEDSRLVRMKRDVWTANSTQFGRNLDLRYQNRLGISAN